MLLHRRRGEGIREMRRRHLRHHLPVRVGDHPRQGRRDRGQRPQDEDPQGHGGQAPPREEDRRDRRTQRRSRPPASSRLSPSPGPASTTPPSRDTRSISEGAAGDPAPLASPSPAVTYKYHQDIHPITDTGCANILRGGHYVRRPYGGRRTERAGFDSEHFVYSILSSNAYIPYH